MISARSKRLRADSDAAIDRLADLLDNGHLLASMGGPDLLQAAADEIVRLRAMVDHMLLFFPAWTSETTEEETDEEI